MARGGAEVASSKVDALEALALAARWRLEQIEHHLHLNSASYRPKAKQCVPPSIDAARLGLLSGCPAGSRTSVRDPADRRTAASRFRSVSAARSVLLRRA
jgi:hypothetical protein